jgi:hypothetical protein
LSININVNLAKSWNSSCRHVILTKLELQGFLERDREDGREGEREGESERGRERERERAREREREVERGKEDNLP